MSPSLLRRVASVTAFVLAGVAAYLCFWPVPAEPVAWSAPAPPGFTGAFAPNTRLAGLSTIDIGDEVGPEHIAIGPDGKLYAAMESGNLLRMERDGRRREVFANTGGRVLGFDFDASGRMIAADAMRGLLAVAQDGRVSVLVDRVADGDPVRYANAIVVAPDGRIYFTDASTRFAPLEWGGTYQASVLDILEQSASGRVLVHDPVAKTTRVVARGFSFANGIALSADERALFVTETGRYRIWKIDSRARDLDIQDGSPQARVLLDNLPGYPDNLMRGRDGRIWVGLFRPRNPAADGLAQRPFLRKVMLRLPRSLLPLGSPYGHVFAFDEGGRVTEDLQDPEGAYPETTGATETPDRLYIHSLHARTIGWVAAMMHKTIRVAALSVVGAAIALSASAADPVLEDIHVLRSIREEQASAAGWCDSSRTGFEPFPTAAERFFSFWSVRSQARGRQGRRRPAIARRRVARLLRPDRRTHAPELLCRGLAGRDLVSRKRRVPRAHDRFPRERPLPRPLPARPGRPAGALCRGAPDDEYDHQQRPVRRRHGPARLHAGLDRHDPPVEGEVGSLTSDGRYQVKGATSGEGGTGDPGSAFFGPPPATLALTSLAQYCGLSRPTLGSPGGWSCRWS